ncbi:LOW QUALITY PROTEIN: proline-rich protein 2-like [Psammomys obesus]|uniref:LOW QUALITY PROTEIN: proline-rich protein 2-like n=1 Tax=Psammomys obesus TaxID=48139 RepID=UPI0024535E62|nr:LOW QUALITY PROTEIN: proline-rich protein 2-like [Psammomys obesus]
MCPSLIGTYAARNLRTGGPVPLGSPTPRPKVPSSAAPPPQMPTAPRPGPPGFPRPVRAVGASAPGVLVFSATGRPPPPPEDPRSSWRPLKGQCRFRPPNTPRGSSPSDCRGLDSPPSTPRRGSRSPSPWPAFPQAPLCRRGSPAMATLPGRCPRLPPEGAVGGGAHPAGPLLPPPRPRPPPCARAAGSGRCRARAGARPLPQAWPPPPPSPPAQPRRFTYDPCPKVFVYRTTVTQTLFPVGGNDSRPYWRQNVCIRDAIMAFQGPF